MKTKLLALTAFLVLALAGTALAGTVIVNGSTTVYPLMQAASEAFMKKNPGTDVALSGGGSGNGAKALIDGSTQIAMMSRDMKDSEIKMAEEKGRKPKQIVAAFDCIVPVVHPENPVKDLTLAQLKDIYTGKITNWKDVGGADGKIVVISRDTSSGTYECWKEKVLGEDRPFAGAMLQASNGAVAQAVSKNKHSIGYVGLGYVNQELKGLTVGGVRADAKTAKDGSFPISRGLNLYVAGEPTGETKALIDFVMSPEGQKIAVDTGFVSVK